MLLRYSWKLQVISWKPWQSDIANEKYSKNKHFINFYHLLSSTVLDRKANSTKEMLKQFPNYSYFCFKFPYFRFSFVYLYCVIYFIKQSEQYLVWQVKSRHLELFCKVIMQISSTGIFLGSLSRGPSRNVTEQRKIGACKS